MTAWLTVSIVVAIGAGALLVAIALVSRELDPTRRTLGEFRSGLEPALLRVRTETDAARQRFAGRRHPG